MSKYDIYGHVDDEQSTIATDTPRWTRWHTALLIAWVLVTLALIAAGQ